MNWKPLNVLLAGLPDLPHAKCKGKAADLFDLTIGGRRERTPGHFEPVPHGEVTAARQSALRLCAACPALDPCRVWLDGQRLTRRPRGVIAGQLITSTGQPSKAWTTNTTNADGTAER